MREKKVEGQSFSFMMSVSLKCCITGSMIYPSSMNIKGAVASVWLDTMRGVGKAHLTFIEKAPIEKDY